MDIQDRRNLEVLDAVSENRGITQRHLAARLGIALGLTNIYLRRLVHKGYIKCRNVHANRILYLITPKGIAEKGRLTYEFMQYSLDLYRQVRQHLRIVLQPFAESGCRAIAIYGTGEAAELAYICLKEVGLEPVAVFSDENHRQFLGMPVRKLDEQPGVPYDLMIVATLGDPQPLIDAVMKTGVPRERLVTLRQQPPKRAARRRNGGGAATA